jgi:hypothetical protein
MGMQLEDRERERERERERYEMLFLIYTRVYPKYSGLTL